MTPEQIVQLQLDAYDAHDIDAFVATYTEDVEIYDHPSTLRMQGHDALRTSYAALFERAPDLKTHITSRITYNDFVIDDETVTGVPGGGTKRAIAIYQVRDGLIAKVWFIAQ
jgi:hypothetical protein